MAKVKYPRTLYKSPGTQKLVSNKVEYTYDSLVVNNEKEQDAGEDMGYIDSFEDAILHMPKTKSKTKAEGVKATLKEEEEEEEGF